MIPFMVCRSERRLSFWAVTKNLDGKGARSFVPQDDNGLYADCWVDKKRRDRHAKEARDDRELADWKHSQASVCGLFFRAPAKNPDGRGVRSFVPQDDRHSGSFWATAKSPDGRGVRSFVPQNDNGLYADCWVDKKRRDRHAKEARDDREWADWKHHSQSTVCGLSFRESAKNLNGSGAGSFVPQDDNAI